MIEIFYINIYFFEKIEDFGFSNILWVFSGRRGIHCWISDLDLVKSPNDLRKCIVDNLSIISVNKNQEMKIFFLMYYFLKGERQS